MPKHPETVDYDHRPTMYLDGKAAEACIEAAKMEGGKKTVDVSFDVESVTMSKDSPMSVRLRVTAIGGLKLSKKGESKEDTGGFGTKREKDIFKVVKMMRGGKVMKEDME